MLYHAVFRARWNNQRIITTIPVDAPTLTKALALAIDEANKGMPYGPVYSVTLTQKMATRKDK